MVSYPFKVAKDVDATICTARMTLYENGILKKNQKPHSLHENHECYFKDLGTRKNIMDKCKMAKEMFPDSTNKISSQFIFNREMARYSPKLFFFFILLIYQDFSRPDKGECSKLDIEKMKRHMDRVKNAKHPMSPTTFGKLKELFEKEDILESYGYNLKATERLYIDTFVADNFAFSLFASFSIMKIITEHIDPISRKYLIDGTFKCVPRLFYQLLIISIEYKNDVSFYRLE